MEIRPRSAYNRYYRGEIYAKIGQYDRALNDYQHALSLKPIFTDAYFGMGMLYWQRKEIPQAIAACRKILEIDRHDARAYSCLGKLLMEQKRDAEAIEIYKKGLGFIPDNDELWYDLGVIYNETGMYSEAAKAFEKATELIHKK